MQRYLNDEQIKLPWQIQKQNEHTLLILDSKMERTKKEAKKNKLKFRINFEKNVNEIDFQLHFRNKQFIDFLNPPK